MIKKRIGTSGQTGHPQMIKPLHILEASSNIVDVKDVLEASLILETCLNF